MKFHTLVIAAVILAALTGLLYWSNHHPPGADAAKTSADTPPAILKLDESAITNLELKKKDAEPVVLAKSGSGDWQITEPKTYRADQGAVSGITSALASLNSDRLVEDKASDIKSFGLERPSFEVELTEKDKKSQKLLIGDDTPTSGGVYAMLGGDPRVFTISSYTKTNIEKSLDDLRDKRLLPVNDDKVSRVEVIKKGADIEFGRNKDEWQIVKPSPMRADGMQVGDLVRHLTEAKMDLSGSSQDAAAQFAKATPLATAKLTDESATQELQVRKSKDNYYAKSTAVEGAYKVDSALGKQLEKNLDDYRNKKLFDFSYNDPNKIEISNGSTSYYLTRGTGGSEDWWSNGKKVDAANVESVVSDLRDLAASKFADSGFSSPTIQATVVSDDGKRTEKVELAKYGDHYVAKREKEPALYQLDSGPVDALLKAAGEVKPAPTQTAQKK